MTITRRLGIGYAILGAVCLLLLACLWHHRFVAEPAAYAARGVSDLHKNSDAEVLTIVFLAVIPMVLCVGWWWTRRVLAPLRTLTLAAQQIESNNLSLPLPRSMNADEVDTLAGVFASMTARLDASFQQIRAFTLHASHELKTPLTVMRAELETALRERTSLTAGETEWIESLLDEVRRLATIVDSLTLLAKADAGLIALEQKPVPFHELVREAYEDAVILAQPQHVHVSLEACVDAPLIGDRHRLRQLLLILLDNAVKYNRPDGEIRIALRKREGAAELQITNDAGRIMPETQRRLFGRFVRGENAMGKVEGCGLGLSIAQWIAQANGGSVDVRTEAGEKFTVLVRFPLAPLTQANLSGKLAEV